MKKFLVNTIYALVGLQKKALTWYYDFKYKKRVGTEKLSRTYITAGETMSLNAQEKLDVKEVVDNAKSLFKENLNEPQKIFDYIQGQGTPVFVVKRTLRVLWFLGEEEGFIPSKSGFGALVLSIYLNIFSEQKPSISFKMPAMFVLRGLDVSPYFLAYQLYHWMAYSKKLSGYDPKTVKNFKSIFALDKDIMAMKNLSIEEILSLREAIARDVEAIEMVVALAKEVAGQKKASDKLKKEGDITI